MSRVRPISTAAFGLLLILLLAVLPAFSPSIAKAVPGPDTTAVLSNANVPESVMLADHYADARDIPSGQRCALPIDETADLTLAAFRAQVVGPLEACLSASGAAERIEAIVVVRGVPLRVTIPTSDGDRRVSLAAALGIMRTTEDGEPMLDTSPSFTATCRGGSPCAMARVNNPFRAGAFESGWTHTSGTFEHHPLLVTMLHGRSYDEAALLVTSALDAEAMGGAPGEMMLMNGGDSARNFLDGDYDGVVAALTDRGFTDVSRVPFDADLTGHALAAFFTGTARMGETIEGNTFHPGALVDNLTSFGAVPANFEPTGESQVSIARWVAMGVAGVHGTTDEPLANAFPARRMIVDYVDGGTLAEAYHRNLPFVYWRNLVLGDPMLAPYAVRPEVTISGVTDGEVVADARMIHVSATDAEGMGVDALALYLDGREVARASGDSLDVCLDVPAGFAGQMLAVAQKHNDGTARGLHRPKGWIAFALTGAEGRTSCDGMSDAGPTPSDAGASGSDGGRARDGGAEGGDGGVAPSGSSGCGCELAGESAPSSGAPLMLIAIAIWVRVRRRLLARAHSPWCA